jgi:peptide/nickel transport system ATP-binding protein
MSVLRVSNLGITLPSGGDRPKAVDGVSFEIAKNEIVCLVGESGSGKSVIAQAIMGLLPKTLRVSAGTIALEGEDLTACGAARLRKLRGARMAMIFQEPMTALNPVMSCGAQIDEVFRFHTDFSSAARTEKAKALLREVSLAEPERILASYPHQLSGGQRQRVMIAMALALEPALLIADEPTTALDVTTQAQILKLVLELQRKHGMAVLFITHDFGVVAEIAHRVAVLRTGELVEAGPKDEVLKRPRHDYTRMLIRAVPTLKPRARVAAPSSPMVLETRSLSKTYSTGGAARPWGSSANRAPASRPWRAASCAWSIRAAAKCCSTARTSPPCRTAGCAPCGAACRSCSRTRTARSTRAARSARRSSRGR